MSKKTAILDGLAEEICLLRNKRTEILKEIAVIDEQIEAVEITTYLLLERVSYQ